MQVFDVHHHFGSFVEPGIDLTLDEQVANHVEMMDQRGVDQAAMLAGSRYPNPNGLEDTRRMNDDLREVRERYGDRFPVSFGTVELRYGDAGLPEVDRIMDDLELDGLTWHTRWQGAYTDDDIVFEYIERASEYDATIVLHGLAWSNMEAAWRVFNVIEAFPDTDFVIVDCLTGSDQNRWILDYHDKFDLDNVVFDTTFMHNVQRSLPRMVDALGSDRIVFGTDVYSDKEMWSTIPLEQVRQSPVSEDDRRAVLYDNAARVFGLD